MMLGPVSNYSYPVSTPKSNRAEELSIAYVSAIAARAGIKIEKVVQTDFGTDMQFKRLRKRTIDGKYTDFGTMTIPCQVKSARAPEWKENVEKNIITYNLRAKNYNDLVDSTSGFLVLLCLPASVNRWITQDYESLRLYKCCYYWIPGSDDELTENDSTKVIHIPRTQLFTAKVLVDQVDNAQVRIRSL